MLHLRYLGDSLSAFAVVHLSSIARCTNFYSFTVSVVTNFNLCNRVKRLIDDMILSRISDWLPWQRDCHGAIWTTVFERERYVAESSRSWISRPRTMNNYLARKTLQSTLISMIQLIPIIPRASNYSVLSKESIKWTQRYIKLVISKGGEQQY